MRYPNALSHVFKVIWLYATITNPRMSVQCLEVVFSTILSTITAQLFSRWYDIWSISKMILIIAVDYLLAWVSLYWFIQLESNILAAKTYTCTCMVIHGREKGYFTILSFLLVKAGIVMCLTFFHRSRPSHSNIPSGSPVVREFIRDKSYNRNNSKLYSTMEESCVT